MAPYGSMRLLRIPEPFDHPDWICEPNIVASGRSRTFTHSMTMS
jgi:hypothetical protein